MSALDTDAFTGQLQAHLPPGAAWSRNPDSDITKSLEGIAPEFARGQVRAEDILREMNPGEAVEMLPEHEDLNGVEPVGTDAQRQAALLAKLQDTAGHNPADYVSWAATLGFPGVVVRRRPIPPLTVGGRCGERAHGAAWAHAYLVEYMADVLTPAANSFNSWSVTSGTVTANTVNGPDGAAGADTIGGFSPLISAAITPSSGVQFSVWLRTATGTPTAGLICGADTLFAPLTSYWKRYEMRSASGSATVSLGATGGTFYAWGAYVGPYDSDFEAAMYQRQQAHAVPIFRVIGDYPKD